MILSPLIRCLPTTFGPDNEGLCGGRPLPWQSWACPDGNLPIAPTHCRAEHPTFPIPTYCPKTTAPRRRCHNLGAAHLRSLHHQARQNHSALAAVPHFANYHCKGRNGRKNLQLFDGQSPQTANMTGTRLTCALINARRNHDLALYMGFVDLAKAYDTTNHTLLLRIVKKCLGAHLKAIQTIYTNIVLKRNW